MLVELVFVKLTADNAIHEINHCSYVVMEIKKYTIGNENKWIVLIRSIKQTASNNE